MANRTKKPPATGIFETREELEEAVLEDVEEGLIVADMAKKYKVSLATIHRISKPEHTDKVEKKRKSRDECNPMTAKLNELWRPSLLTEE